MDNEKENLANCPRCGRLVRQPGDPVTCINCGTVYHPKVYKGTKW